MQKAEKRFQQIFQKYNNSNIDKKDLTKLDVNKRLCNTSFPITLNKIKILVSLAVILTLIVSQTNLLNNSVCFVDMPPDASKWFREPETCSICEKITKILKVENISSSDFYSNFVQPAKPVVVTDGAKYWPASEKFTFDFFKDLYQNNDYDEDTSFCQFFPYKTEFNSLYEALAMDPRRARLEAGEKSWYIGWSNCNDHAGKILRRYYDVPYFLPNVSENIALNWIFMGGPGQGAHMHVDNVQYPSWQAQLKGKKLWRLAPPPECFYKCQEVEVIVESGEIIVVDTNRWYHQTFILPGEISITIGSEFD